MNDYELYHHGVKGQKWGVRRTPAQLGHRTTKTISKADVKKTAIKVGNRALNIAGKTGKVLYKGAKTTGKAVGKGVGKAGKATARVIGKGANKAKRAAKRQFDDARERAYYKKLHKKKLSQMTDKEIEDLTKRVQKEAALKDVKYESRVQNARKFYKNVAQQPVNTFFATYSKKAIESAFKDATTSTDDSSSDKTKSDSSKTDKNKTNKNEKQNDTIEFTIETREESRKNRKPAKGTANPYNNPIIIRHDGTR